MRILSIGVLLLGFSFCARQKPALTDQDLYVNQLVTNLINASNPNALDKIVFSRSNGDGSVTTRFNATNLDFYIYFQFEANKQIPFSEKDTLNWDIAFNRYKVATNSGETNRFGLGGACKSNTTDFATASSTSATSQGCSTFTTDSAATTQGIGGAGSVFVGNPLVTEWYNYSIGELSPKPDIFLIRSGSGNSIYAVHVENYYSDAGTSGYPTIRWKKLP
ncbi:heme-binding protein HmuY [Leptospira kemamanensis]|uniref:Heme-binding protein HmuY n=1 Tax=Leptospira kemamanensis TaxID=2484942 RepID=A0A4R9JR80_9LEPT|nr:heme-binding protein HmuY [Leptospira kemamanensis]